MRRKRNWILKRMILGLAVMALAVPAVANAKLDEGGVGMVVQGGVGSHGAPGAVFKAADKGAGAISIETVRLNPRSTSSDAFVKTGDYGMPRAMPSDYGLQRGDSIEIARTHPRNVVTADIENVRLQPRTTSTPELVSAGFDWSDAGVGAAIAFGLVLLGGVAFLATRNQGKPQSA
jgi:hypothetical protein